MQVLQGDLNFLSARFREWLETGVAAGISLISVEGLFGVGKTPLAKMSAPVGCQVVHLDCHLSRGDFTWDEALRFGEAREAVELALGTGPVLVEGAVTAKVCTGLVPTSQAVRVYVKRMQFPPSPIWADEGLFRNSHGASRLEQSVIDAHFADQSWGKADLVIQHLPVYHSDAHVSAIPEDLV